MAFPTDDTLFIGIIRPANADQKRSEFINGLSRGYTASEIAGLGSANKSYWFETPIANPNGTSYVQHDDFISTAQSPKVIYQFEVISAGTDMVTGEMTTYDPLTGTFSFEADLSEQPVRVNYWANFEFTI